MRTIDEIDSECAAAVLELGRKTYHAHLLKREIGVLNRRVFALNAEALAVHGAQAVEGPPPVIDDSAAEGAANE